jgi:predicted metal-dependent hydrolase
VVFDWSELPMHWVPDDPFTTHLFNVLHLLLPEGERWFVRVFTEALPMIKDPMLIEDVRGFIGQESMHAESHQGVLDHLNSHGLDTGPYVDQVCWLFGHALGERTFSGPRAAKRREDWLVERVAEVAAIEHFTAVLGDAILNSPGLDSHGVDPVMLDLLRWHGAEEVEHRAVAFDLYQHLDGRYLRRVRQMLVVAPGLLWLWLRGVSFLMANDPTGRRRPTLRDVLALPKYGLPSIFALFASFLPYLKRDYHPSQHGSTNQAVAYLASSPSAQLADRRAGR